MRGLRRLAARGCTVTLGFVRGHAGIYGNEFADSACSWETKPENFEFPEGVPVTIPSHLFKTCMKIHSRRSFLHQLRKSKSPTATHLACVMDYSCAGNPVLQRASEFPSKRKYQIAYSQLRLGSIRFAQAFNPDRGKRGEICRYCGASAGVRHTLFKCPHGSEARDAMRAAIEASNRERKRIRGEASLRRGVHDDDLKHCDYGSVAILQYHPRPVLGFLAGIDFWFWGVK